MGVLPACLGWHGLLLQKRRLLCPQDRHSRQTPSQARNGYPSLPKFTGGHQDRFWNCRQTLLTVSVDMYVSSSSETTFGESNGSRECTSTSGASSMFPIISTLQ